MAMRLEADGRQNVVENQQEEDERRLDRGIALDQILLNQAFQERFTLTAGKTLIGVLKTREDERSKRPLRLLGRRRSKKMACFTNKGDKTQMISASYNIKKGYFNFLKISVE